MLRVRRGAARLFGLRLGQFDLYEKPSVVDFSSLPHTCRGEMIDPNVDEKTREYAQALDRSQREADYSLGAVFAQKVIITCQ